MKNLQADTITVYNKLGEDESGRAVWQRTVVRKVSLFGHSGVKQYPARMLEPDDYMAVYVFDKSSVAERVYLEPTAFDALVDHTAHYTIRKDGQDRVFIGETHAEKPADAKEALRPLSVAHNRKGSPRMWHMKITCQ